MWCCRRRCGFLAVASLRFLLLWFFAVFAALERTGEGTRISLNNGIRHDQTTRVDCLFSRWDSGTHCGPLPPAPFHRDIIRLGEGAPTHVRAHPLSTDGRLTGTWTSYDSPRLRVMLAEPPQPPKTQSLTLNSGDICEI